MWGSWREALLTRSDKPKGNFTRLKMGCSLGDQGALTHSHMSSFLDTADVPSCVQTNTFTIYGLFLQLTSTSFKQRPNKNIYRLKAPKTKNPLTKKTNCSRLQTCYCFLHPKTKQVSLQSPAHPTGAACAEGCASDETPKT